jgi:DNA-binding GntR family transcriptional regulator
MTAVAEHRAIVGAIQQGDSALAREHAQQHRRAACDHLPPLLSEVGMKHL